jgi:hypothetical protein
MSMAPERDRVISISLTEAEWRAFVAQHPQPVTWIQDRIREQLRASTIETENLELSSQFFHPSARRPSA